jgi:TPR repeat protein
MSLTKHPSKFILQILSLCSVISLVPLAFSDIDNAKMSLDIDDLTLSAESGDAASQYQLGTLYDEGDGIDENNEKAVEWYRKSAEQGYAKAQGYLSQMYFLGEGVQLDDEKAAYWARKAANQGDALGQNNVGFMYHTGRGATEDSLRAIEWYLLAAEQGLAMAQVNLSDIYLYGEGVDEDHERAFYWASLAAQQGDALGQVNLGTMYDDGYGVPEDNSTAIGWYRKAAAQNNALGQAMIGRMYYSGEGVDEDNERAFHWASLAADQGDASGQYLMGLIYDGGHGIAEDKSKAFQLFEKAADQEHPLGEISLGKAYLNGFGVESDYERALYWFRNAAESDQPEAQYYLGLMFDEGFGVDEDNSKAIEFYRKAADQGNGDALNNLGVMYDVGEGVAKDVELAEQFYRRGADVGSQAAYENFYKFVVSRGVSNRDQIPDSRGLEFGDYHALVIGNSRYEYLDDLTTAGRDASDVAEVLRDKYDFEVELLLDATRKDILTSLNRLRRELKETDNFLLYYAGHGVLDEIKEGYWQPVDSDIDDDSEWISNKRINSTLKKFKANNVLLMADSCYAGAQFRGIKPIDEESSSSIDSSLTREALVQRLSKAKSRVAITSGGLEPVVDRIGLSENSVFARSFIDTLNENKTLITSGDMFTSVRQRVVPITAEAGFEQTPEFGKLWASGHKGGDFIFLRVGP